MSPSPWFAPSKYRASNRSGSRQSSSLSDKFSRGFPIILFSSNHCSSSAYTFLYLTVVLGLTVLTSV